MRTPLIAGNWKMNLNRVEALALAKAVADASVSVDGVELVVCPPTVYLDAVAGAVAGSRVKLGAQNMYHEAVGAFTGETSAAMLVDIGCRFVILGHSERRQLMGETDDEVCRKTQAALAAGLTPIVCVGETLDQRQSGATAEVIARQFQGSLAGVDNDQITSVVIAYEPVWAIGTGQVATPDQAEDVHSHLRKLLENGYTSDLAQQVRLLYGGSVKPSNAAELLARPNVDGALVGGASLKAADFMGIVAGV